MVLTGMRNNLQMVITQLNLKILNVAYLMNKLKNFTRNMPDQCNMSTQSLVHYSKEIHSSVELHVQ